jgi:alanine racemase
VIAVVKADAYGHGAVQVARRLVEAGCPRLAVLTLEEAAALRGAGIAVPILLLGGIHAADEAREMAELRLTPALQHAGQLEMLAGVAGERLRPIPVHLEVDTGMRRMGLPPDSAMELLEEIQGQPGLFMEGIYTHFACADEEDLGASHEQLAQFAGFLAAARARGIIPSLIHVANSAGLLAGAALAGSMPEGVNAVRPGLMLYGGCPSPHLEARLSPVMTLHSRVVQVRRVSPGQGVGYGWTHRARHFGYLATLPIGYEDGVPWSASNRGCVWLRGRRAAVVGRVSMDFITVDAGEGPVEVGDEAIVFGAGPQGVPSLEEAARAAGTIPYELLVRVGARVPRVSIG